jgi:anti-sigma factor RsiW
MDAHLNEQLSAYLDGDLAGDELARADAHLASCEACRAELEGLRRLVRRAGSLDDRPPEKDLWSGIASRIGTADTSDVIPLEPRRRRFSFTVPQLAAAVLALMAMSVAVGVMLSGSHRPVLADRPVADSAAPRARNVDLHPGDYTVTSYDSAIAGMETMLAERRGQLDTSTVRVLEQSLKTIDAAIAQARRAVAQDPNNRYLNGHLRQSLDSKLELLRQAATLSVQS